jgi:hypothetical protein
VFPEKDQIWFQRTPYVQAPACFRTTAVGPTLHFSVPSVGWFVDGRLMAGPTPQMSRPFDGDKKNDVRMSLTPRLALSKRGGSR